MYSFFLCVPGPAGKCFKLGGAVGGELSRHFGFQRGVMVASRPQLGFPA
jgi:hypothetical protein